MKNRNVKLAFILVLFLVIISFGNNIFATNTGNSDVKNSDKIANNTKIIIKAYCDKIQEMLGREKIANTLGGDKEILHGKKSLYDWVIERIDSNQNYSNVINALAIEAVNISPIKDANGEVKYAFSDTDARTLRGHLNYINRQISGIDDTSFDPSLINSGDVNSGIQNTTKSIVATLLLLLQVASVAGIIVTGLRYMFVSADAKADIKKSSISLAIGLIIVFCASSIVSVTTNIFDEMVNGNGGTPSGSGSSQIQETMVQ